MAANSLIKTVKLNQFTLSCHKDARPAFLASKNFCYQLKQKYLCKEFVEIAQSLEPLHVSPNTDNDFHFFAGWHWLDLCQNAGVNQIQIITYKDIDSHQIENLSWHYLLSKHSTDLNRKSNLEQLITFVDKIPMDIRKNLLGGQHSYSALATISNLTDETRSSLRHQFDKKSEPKTLETSILLELLGGD